MDTIALIEYTKKLLEKTNKKYKTQLEAAQETEEQIKIATAQKWVAVLPGLNTKYERQIALANSTKAAIKEMEDTLKKAAK